MKTITAKDSLTFVICKATQGKHFVDSKFKYNWKTIKEKGLIRGTYHFYSCNVSPEAQATHFLTIISGIDSNDIAPVLDIESGSMHEGVSGEKMVEDILLFLKIIQEKLNRKPIIYTNYAFAQEYFKDSKHSSELAKYDLWLAEYTNKSLPLVPDTWKEKGFKFWQKSATYHINSRTVDYDEFIGLKDEIVK